MRGMFDMILEMKQTLNKMRGVEEEPDVERASEKACRREDMAGRLKLKLSNCYGHQITLLTILSL